MVRRDGPGREPSARGAAAQPLRAVSPRRRSRRAAAARRSRRCRPCPCRPVHGRSLDPLPLFWPGGGAPVGRARRLALGGLAAASAASGFGVGRPRAWASALGVTRGVGVGVASRAWRAGVRCGVGPRRRCRGRRRASGPAWRAGAVSVGGDRSWRAPAGAIGDGADRAGRDRWAGLDAIGRRARHGWARDRRRLEDG